MKTKDQKNHLALYTAWKSLEVHNSYNQGLIDSTRRGYVTIRNGEIDFPLKLAQKEQGNFGTPKQIPLYLGSSH